MVDASLISGFQYYQIQRQRVVDEDNLLNIRNTWVLFFSTALGTLFAGISAFERVELGTLTLADFVRISCGLIGFIICVVASLAAHAALAEMTKLNTDYIDTRDARFANDPLLPQSLLGKNNRHEIGHRLSQGVPVFFSIVWLLVLLFSFVNLRHGG